MMKKNITWQLDMKEIIRKALVKQGGRVSNADKQSGNRQINISHLNPLKSVKGYKFSILVRDMLIITYG
jgi:hypothetical protein